MDKGTSLEKRYFIRMGRTGWMIYDRERRGPALLGTGWAASLTKDQAERLHQILISPGPSRPLRAGPSS